MGTIVGASDESYMRLVDNIGRGETMLGMYEQSNFRNIFVKSGRLSDARGTMSCLSKLADAWRKGLVNLRYRKVRRGSMIPSST